MSIGVKLLIVVSLLAAAILVSGSFGNSDEAADVRALVDGNTTFALDLYQQLKSAEGNLFFSPHSISTALAMTYAGARGNTAKQMSRALHLKLDEKQLHKAFGQLEAQLRAFAQKEKVELSFANALWAQKDYRFLEQFLNLVKHYYRAELSYADFKTAHESARGQINDWVERQTNDKIKDLIKPGVLNALTRLVLANAIYFKGLWESQFDKSITRDAEFWLDPDTTVDVPMMSQEHEFNYVENDQLQVLELPYAGNDLSMTVLLPKKHDGLAELESSLTAHTLRSLVAKSHEQTVTVYLPRFKLTSQFSLQNTLAAMGMPDAFSQNTADFSAMDGNRMLYISAVVHKAFVDVNEEGTEAAAATGVVVSVTAMPVRPAVFRADHPFVFLIRDIHSGSILFLGRVVDPTK
jgi:serpin B